MHNHRNRNRGSISCSSAQRDCYVTSSLLPLRFRDVRTRPIRNGVYPGPTLKIPASEIARYVLRLLTIGGIRSQALFPTRDQFEVPLEIRWSALVLLMQTVEVGIGRVIDLGNVVLSN